MTVKRIEVKVPRELLRKAVLHVSDPHWSPAPYYLNGKRNKTSRVVVVMTYID